jgi:hypothetical protein
MRFLVLFLFMSQNLIDPDDCEEMQFNIFSPIRGDICAQSLTFCGLSAESENFPRIIPPKGMPFWGIILGKSKLFADCSKAGFSTVKYAESFSFRGLSDNS